MPKTILDEAKALTTWQHRGIDCYTKAAPNCAALNGYIQLPETHPLFDVNEEALPFQVHGGLTYVGNDGLIGFDTLHAGDYWPEEALLDAGMDTADIDHQYRKIVGHHHDKHCKHWTKQLLRDAVTRLAGHAADWADKFNRATAISLHGAILHGDTAYDSAGSSLQLHPDLFRSLPPHQRGKILTLISDITELVADIKARQPLAPAVCAEIEAGDPS